MGEKENATCMRVTLLHSWALLNLDESAIWWLLFWNLCRTIYNETDKDKVLSLIIVWQCFHISKLLVCLFGMFDLLTIHGANNP